jgi:hypothetical protein
MVRRGLYVGRMLLLLLEDRVVTQAFALRLLAVLADGMLLVALEGRAVSDGSSGKLVA